MLRHLALAALALLASALVVPCAQAAAPTYVGQLCEAKEPADPADLSVQCSAAVQAGTDRRLIVVVSYRSVTVGATVTSVTFNGSLACTSIASADNATTRSRVVSIWDCDDPAVTTGNVVAVLGGTDSQSDRISVYQFNNVDSFGATATATGSSVTPSINLLSTTADATLFSAVHLGSSTGTPFIPGTGDTELTDGASGASVANDFSFTDETTDAPSVNTYTISSTANATGLWSMAIVEVIPTAVTPPAANVTHLTLIDVGGGTAAAPPPVTSQCTVNIAPGANGAVFQSTLTNAPSGAVVCGPPNQTTVVTATLNLDCDTRDIVFDLQGGTIQQGGPVTVMTVLGNHPWTRTVSAIAVSGGDTLLTISSTANSSVGDWVKVVADDAIKSWAVGASHRLGQAMQIKQIVSGTQFLLEGQVRDRTLYVTNKRATIYESGACEVRNGRFRGDQSHPTWIAPLLRAEATVAFKAHHLRAWDNNSTGIDILDSVDTDISEVDIRNLLSDNAAGFFGYAVNDQSNRFTHSHGVYTESVRDAVNTNSIAVAANSAAGRYGAALDDLEEDYYAYEPTLAGTDGGSDWHTGSEGVTILHYFQQGGRNVNTARGRENFMRDSMSFGSTRGSQIFDEFPAADSAFAGCAQTFDGFIARELVDFGMYCSNTVCSSTATPSSERNTITNSRMEVVGTGAGNAAASCLVDAGGNTFLSNQSNPVENHTGTNGADFWPAGNGNDTMSMLGGNDVVWPGPGNDTVTLGSGVDTWMYARDTDGADTITDFVAGSGGDILYVGPVLHVCQEFGSDPVGDGYTRAIQSGGDTLIQLDCTGGANSFVTIATLTGVTAANLIPENWRYTLGQ